MSCECMHLLFKAVDYQTFLETPATFVVKANWPKQRNLMFFDTWGVSDDLR